MIIKGLLVAAGTAAGLAVIVYGLYRFAKLMNGIQ